MVEHALQRLGLDAKSTGRNDILLNGKKISGNAFYHLPKRSIVHGTMLYDTNLEHMARAITPSDLKLKSKGVESVRKHVTTLNRYISIGIEDFKTYLRTALCNESVVLTPDDIRAIEVIEREYYNPQFIYGNNPQYSVLKSIRVEGVGELHACIDIKNDFIEKVVLSGDYLSLGDTSAMLDMLKGVRYSRDAVEAALQQVECGSYIMNLRKDEFINLLFN